MKYLLTLITEEGGMEDRSPEEMREAMGLWQAFTDEAVKAGAFISGEGLQPSATATTVHIPDGGAGERTVTDGPFAESKEQLGGFYLLECSDLDDALGWAKKIPMQGGVVEVRPVMDYEGAYESPPTEGAAAAS
jgi:hypothetical protein